MKAIMARALRCLKAAGIVFLVSVDGCCGFPEGNPPWPQG